jgi:hypothetical protein
MKASVCHGTGGISTGMVWCAARGGVLEALTGRMRTSLTCPEVDGERMGDQPGATVPQSEAGLHADQVAGA